MSWSRKSLLAVLAVSLPLAASCNRRVFEPVQTSCDVTIGDAIEVPTDKAADILIVVDNSGSMQEEQVKLAANFLNQDEDECPLQDLANIDPLFKNPIREVYTGDGPLAKCGFIQLLAAFENDFRVGVITTDVGLCDNRLSEQGGAPENWGFRPQRGCLQPDGAPNTGARKLIAAADLVDDDGGNNDFAQRFKDTLDNISIFGSQFERGLDAMAIFLDGNATRAPGCEGDLETFRRSGAALVVIFLTDEEDCSHGLGDGAFGDELEDEVCNAFSDLCPGDPATCCPTGETCFTYDQFTSAPSSSDCYEQLAQLPPTSIYVDALLAADPNAKVAVIAGGLDGPDQVAAAGCTIGVDGNPAGGCFLSQGNSNFTQLGDCSADAVAARGTPCCLADPGSRYYEFAEQVGKSATDSICNASFRGTMIEIAAFIAAVDFVDLAEEPVSPTAIVVTIKRAGAPEPETIAPLPNGADCALVSGWLLENRNTRVRLCGAARPGPGDTIDVRAKGQPNQTCLDNAQ